MSCTSRGRGQFRIAKRLAGHNPLHDIAERVLVVAVVDAELLLLDIGVEVLNADFVERTDDGAPEQAPYVLDTVSTNVTNEPLFVAVANAFVANVSRTMLRRRELRSFRRFTFSARGSNAVTIPSAAARRTCLCQDGRARAGRRERLHAGQIRWTTEFTH